MILATAAGRTRFITQPDHAALAGRLLEAWGGEAVDAPMPEPAVRLAVHAHDDGWWPWDRRPQLGPDGSPRDFHEIPVTRWMRLHRRGIDEVTRADPYAGLLVSLHAVGLRCRRYGLSPTWPEPPVAVRGFIGRERRRQRSLATALREDDADDRLSVEDVALLTALHDDGVPPSDVAPGGDRDPRLWRNYRLLVALDALSLRICATPTRADSTEGGVDAGAGPTVGDIGPIELGHVPTRSGEPDTALSATALSGDDWRLDPYPFERSPVTVSVPARTVAATSFPDERTLFERYYGAETEEVRVTLRPA